MLCAFSFPYLDEKLQRLEELSPSPRLVIKTFIVSVTLGIGYVWYINAFALDKYSYNKVHPFTSWVPIACYLVLRNMSPLLRRYHCSLFAWTGKITLETYILQFHIWMKTTGLNGSPKFLMVWLDGASSRDLIT